MIAGPVGESLTEEEWRQGVSRIRPMDLNFLPELEWDFSALYNKNKVFSVFSQQMIAIVKATDWKSAVPGGVTGQPMRT